MPTLAPALVSYACEQQALTWIGPKTQCRRGWWARSSRHCRQRPMPLLQSQAWHGLATYGRGRRSCDTRIKFLCRRTNTFSSSSGYGIHPRLVTTPAMSYALPVQASSPGNLLTRLACPTEHLLWTEVCRLV